MPAEPDGALLRAAGLRTATVSSFGERHAAWHFYAGFNDILNSGKTGMDVADDVTPLALDWLDRNGRRDDWFLHVNYWDAHIPYRSPPSFAQRFADTPLPVWPDETTRAKDWHNATGSFSPQEVCGFGLGGWEVSMPQRFPLQPTQIADERDLRRMFDGYDGGIACSDEHVGRLLNHLADLGVLDDTAIIISADHGENLGELAVYGDHQTADHVTACVPMIVRWPGVTDANAGRAVDGLHHTFDVAAAAVTLCGGDVPADWDGRCCAAALKDPAGAHGREELVVSTGTSTVQRSVRFGDHLVIQTLHDGYHLFPEWLCFDVAADPHEQHDLAARRPDLLAQGRQRLEGWLDRTLARSPVKLDPLQTALQDGGPYYTWGKLPAYLDRLEQTGRGRQAAALRARQGSASNQA